MVFVLSLFVSHLSFLWCYGKVAFLIVAFPRYFHLFVETVNRKKYLGGEGGGVGLNQCY